MAQNPTAPWLARGPSPKADRPLFALLLGLALGAAPGASVEAADGAPAAAPESFDSYVEASFVALADRPTPTRATCDTAICVHYEAAADEPVAAELLTSARDSFDALLALKLPRPLSDGRRGGDGRVDVYLDPSRARPDTWIDPGSASSGWDRATAFITSPALGNGCVRQNELAEAVAKVLLASQDGGLEPNAANMLSGYLGLVTKPCAITLSQAVDFAQRAPERTFTGRRGQPGPASLLFPWFLEESFGSGEIGTLSMSLAAISSQRTTKGPLLDEPDMFDSLRITQLRNQTSLAQTLLDHAVARAFLGSRSDGLHLTDVEQLGDFGRPRVEWSVTHKSLPRRLAPLRPIESLGATYLFVDLKGAASGAELTFVADWEEPVAFRWALVKLDKDGIELGRVDAVPVLGETHIEKTVRELGDAASLLIVGVNEGEGRRDEPFDTARPHEEPHAYLVTLYP